LPCMIGSPLPCIPSLLFQANSYCHTHFIAGSPSVGGGVGMGQGFVQDGDEVEAGADGYQGGDGSKDFPPSVGASSPVDPTVASGGYQQTLWASTWCQAHRPIGLSEWTLHKVFLVIPLYDWVQSPCPTWSQSPARPKCNEFNTPQIKTE